MSAKRSDLSGLGALSESLCEGASPDDCLVVADKMAELKAVCEGVERDMGTRRRVLEDGMEQVSVWGCVWGCEGVKGDIIGTRRR